MSREIDLTKPLSDEDRQYLEVRSRFADIATADANAAGEDAPVQDSTPGGVSGVTVGSGSPDSADPAKAAQQVPEPARQAGDAENDNGSTEDEYRKMSNEDLRDELEKRDLSKSGNKDDMVARLLENDSQSS